MSAFLKRGWFLCLEAISKGVSKYGGRASEERGTAKYLKNGKSSLIVLPDDEPRIFGGHATNLYQVLPTWTPPETMTTSTHTGELGSLDKPFDCLYDGDWQKCDKEMCGREKLCRRRT